MKSVYIVTCKDSLTEEKYVFENLDNAEKCLAQCVKQAFEWEETETDDDGWTEEECMINWEFKCGDYSAKIEIADVIG